MTINNTNRLKQVIDSQAADLLTIELIDTFEIKDLKINLANKEVYQLINKVNNAKYYYDQIKDQRQ